jgi:phosphoribosyl 1,2-cyclic phosphodiesterase
MIDCGLDWLGKFARLRSNAILLTHAHPDHAWGLRNGAPCLVYATQKTWRTLRRCKIAVKLREIAVECGVEASIAHDRMALVLR